MNPFPTSVKVGNALIAIHLLKDGDRDSDTFQQPKDVSTFEVSIYLNGSLQHTYTWASGTDPEGFITRTAAGRFRYTYEFLAVGSVKVAWFSPDSPGFADSATIQVLPL